MERIELLARVCGPRDPQIQTPVNFICVENSKVLCMPTICMIWRLWKRIFMKQFTTFSNVNCNKFSKICLKEFRHVSQQRADILNIFYDGEYNINYYIWLKINERSKQYVVTGHAWAFLLARDTAVSQEFVGGKISIQSVCALSTLHVKHTLKSQVSQYTLNWMHGIHKVRQQFLQCSLKNSVSNENTIFLHLYFSS
jgi:hypothetical protein